MIDYQKQAEQLLRKLKVVFTAHFIKHSKYFESDIESRNIWELWLVREGKAMSVTFGQATASTGVTPTIYDLLSTLAKNDPGTFEDFCADCGYNTDSRKAERIYNEVKKQWGKVSKFFTKSEISQLQEVN